MTRKMLVEGCKHCGLSHARLTEKQCAERQRSEASFQRSVVAKAHKYGWKAVHSYASIVGGTEEAPVYATAVSKDALGYPDWSFWKAGYRPIFAELKRELSHPAPEQWAWLDLLLACGQIAVVWRPSDLPAIERVFKSGVKLEQAA